MCDKIAGEIQRSFDFYIATTVDARLGRIYLSGVCAAVPALAKTIEMRSGVPVHTMPFLESVQAVLLKAEHARHRFVIPIGLALRDTRKLRRAVPSPAQPEKKKYCPHCGGEI